MPLMAWIYLGGIFCIASWVGYSIRRGNDPEPIVVPIALIWPILAVLAVPLVFGAMIAQASHPRSK